MMKILFALPFALLIAHASASAAPAAPAPSPAKNLLRCSISSGPDQEVAVWETDGALSLHEFTTAGARLQRPLSSAEWASRRLRLRKDFPAEENVLTAENGAWTFYGQGAGVTIVVLADCW